MRLIDADKLKENFDQDDWGQYLDSDVRRIIDETPTVEQVVVFTESTDEKTIADLKVELQNILEKRPFSSVSSGQVVPDNLQGWRCGSTYASKQRAYKEGKYDGFMSAPYGDD